MGNAETPVSAYAAREDARAARSLRVYRRRAELHALRGGWMDGVLEALLAMVAAAASFGFSPFLFVFAVVGIVLAARLVVPMGMKAYAAGGLFGSPSSRPIQLAGGGGVAVVALVLWLLPGVVHSPGRAVALGFIALCALLGAWFADDPLIFAAAVGAVADQLFGRLLGDAGGPFITYESGFVMMALALALAVASAVRYRGYLAWAEELPTEAIEHAALQSVHATSRVERHAAINKLGFACGADSIEPLVRAMWDADPNIANTAAAALDLARCGLPERWVDRALDTAGYGDGDEVSDVEFHNACDVAARRWMDTTTAIYRELVRDDSVADRLISLVTPESSHKMLGVAALVLTDGHSERGIDHVAGLLGNPILEVSRAAEAALSASGLLGMRRVLAALDSGDPAVRASATRAVVGLVAHPIGRQRERASHDPRFGDSNDVLPRDEDALELAEYRATLPSVLTPLLADGNPEVRRAATECLALLEQ